VYYVPSEPPVYEAQPVPRVRHETPPPQVIAKVAQVQENLRKAGYYKGTVDGLMGPATKSAIRSYQVEKGLPVTGLIDKELLLDLGL
jgi:peptidoglycan hydrolase-like protein with peptidoglycan-binding domain